MQSRAQIWDLHPESVRCRGCGLSTRYLASGDSSRLEFSKKYISRAHNSSKTFKIILFNLPVTFVRFLVVIGTFRNAREAISAKILKNPDLDHHLLIILDYPDHPQDRTHVQYMTCIYDKLQNKILVRGQSARSAPNRLGERSIWINLCGHLEIS